MPIAMTFRTKLTLSVFGVCLILLVASAVGLSNVKRLAAVSDDIGLRHLPAIDVLLQADRDYHQALVAERTMLLDDLSSEQLRALERERKENIEQAAQRLARFGALMDAPEVEQRLRQHEQLRQSWAETSARVAALRAQDRLEEARALSLGAASEQFARMRAVVDELSEYTSNHNAALSAQVERTTRSAVWTLTGLTIAGLAIGAALTVILPLLVTGSLNRIITRMREISDGNGDLTARLEVTSRDEFGQLAESFNRFVEKLEQLVRQCTVTAARVREDAGAIQESTARLGQTVEAQRAGTDQVAVAINEMAATIQEVARSTSQAARATEDADAQARNGQATVQQTALAIEQLSEQVGHAYQVIRQLEAHSHEIGAVLAVIQGVAEQTNLLALNAAIEAARAGEQGRGFAVVADEVRSLASRTQQSTKEIQAIIERLQSSAHEAAEAMQASHEDAQRVVRQSQETLVTLSAVSGAVESIADQNAQIASAAEEQSAVAEDINRNIEDTRHLAEQSATGARNMQTAAQRIAQSAEELAVQLTRFRTRA